MVLKNLFAGQQWRNRHREQTYGRGGRGGDGETYGESTMETYTTVCKTDGQRNLLCVSRNSNRGSVATKRGAMGREMGGRFKTEGISEHLWLIHAEV